MNFYGQKKWPPKFHIKFRNIDPCPYLGNIPKKQNNFFGLGFPKSETFLLPPGLQEQVNRASFAEVILEFLSLIFDCKSKWADLALWSLDF